MIRKTLQLIIVATFTISLFTIATSADTPKESIKSTVDAVLNIMRDKNLVDPAKKQERRDKIGALIRDRFDFEEMSKRSLARHWKKITQDEKKEFISIFSDLLESSYVGKIEAYTDEKVTYDKETVKGKGKYGVINTTIVTKSVDIPIDYKVINKKDKWWVYDVVIEGVSFISTYRSQYNKIIVKKSFTKLLQSMKKKLKQINTLEEKETS